MHDLSDQGIMGDACSLAAMLSLDPGFAGLSADNSMLGPGRGGGRGFLIEDGDDQAPVRRESMPISSVRLPQAAVLLSVVSASGRMPCLRLTHA